MKSLNIEEEQVDEESANLIAPKSYNTKPNRPNTFSAIIPVEYDKNALGEFALSFFGLLISYVTWGIMQELIMNTQFNETPLVPTGMFPSTTFCVFANRVFAIVVAIVACKYKHGSLFSNAPLYSFSPPALSNTISSWAQYESLSYVSFPLQNLFKSTKLIPVMFMGRLINGTTYTSAEVIEAVCISIGVLIFSTAKASQHNAANGVSGKDASATGMFLLCVYVLSDSFTSQYQSSVFKKYGKIDQYHMMFGVNLSAIVITMFALVMNSDIPVVAEFLLYNPLAVVYILVTAVCSATGQLFIYYTIKRFGPVVFTIIMTTRQIVSMIVSSIYFSHPFSFAAVIGSVIVFSAVINSIRRQVEKQSQKAVQASASDRT